MFCFSISPWVVIMCGCLSDKVKIGMFYELILFFSSFPLRPQPIMGVARELFATPTGFIVSITTGSPFSVCTRDGVNPTKQRLLLLSDPAGQTNWKKRGKFVNWIKEIDKHKSCFIWPLGGWNVSIMSRCTVLLCLIVGIKMVVCLVLPGCGAANQEHAVRACQEEGAAPKPHEPGKIL